MASQTRAALVERRYREAARHTRWVRFLRRAIPIGSAATVAAILFVGIVQPFRTLPDGVSIANISLNGTKITMELPRLTGFKKDSRPYEVTAQWAAQDVKKPNIIELKELRARIAMQDKSMANVTSVEGVYDSSIEKLDLKTDVRVKTDSGYDVRMNSARVDFKGGNVSSQEPVSVRFSGGTIDAGNLDMTDNGQHIIFDGRVRTILTPQQERTASAKDKSP